MSNYNETHENQPLIDQSISTTLSGVGTFYLRICPYLCKLATNIGHLDQTHRWSVYKTLMTSLWTQDLQQVCALEQRHLGKI